MKKFYLLIMFVFTAAIAGAQENGKAQNFPKGKKIKALRADESRRTKTFAPLGAGADTTYITERPEGEYRIYNRAGRAIYLDFDGIYEVNQGAFVVEMVFSADRVAYMRNPLTMVNNDSWVRGTVSEDGTKFTLDPDQYIAYDRYSKGYLQLGMGIHMPIADGEDEVGSYSRNYENPDISFTIDGSTITLDNPGGHDMDGLAVFYAGGDNDGYWAGFTDCETVLTQTDVHFVTPPEGMEVMRCQLISERAYSDELNDYDGRLVNVGYSGTDVYVQGISNKFPNGWLKGTINIVDMSVNMPYAQMLGVANGYIYYFMAADRVTVSTEWGEFATFELGTDLTLNYDPETQTMSSDRCMLINTNLSFLSYDVTYIKPAFSIFGNTPATPRTPLIINVGDYYEIEGDYGVAIRTSSFAADGTFLNPEHLYFSVYLDEQLLTFDTGTYPVLTENTIEIPIGMGDGEYFIHYDNWTNFYVFRNDFDSIGVQQVYHDGDIVMKSDIYYWVLTPNDISTVNADDTVTTAPVYDLSGRRVNADALHPGIYIRKGKKFVVR